MLRNLLFVSIKLHLNAQAWLKRMDLVWNRFIEQNECKRRLKKGDKFNSGMRDDI